MKKQVKGIIGLGAVLALLGGGYAALKLTDPDKNKEGESSSAVASIDDEEKEGAGTLLISDNGEEADVKSVTVKNSSDELNVVILSEKTENSATRYTLDGYQDLNMNISVIGTLVNNGNGLTALALIDENCSSLEKYGLDNPKTTVVFNYASGTVRTLYIGNEAPSGSGIYVMTDESTSVYTVQSSYLANYEKTTKELIEKTVLEKPADEDMPIIESLRIERENLDYDILIQYDHSADDTTMKGGTSSTHLLIEPVEANLTVERSTDITTGMFGLSAEDIYSAHCTESDIAQAGLSEPFCRVTMDCGDGKSYVLLLSETFTDDSGKHCYGMLEGSKVIFILSPDKAKWTTVLPIDIASRIIISDYVWYLSELNVKCGTEEKEFKIAPKSADTDLNTAKTEDFSVTCNGNALDAERFRTFYSFLVSTNAEEFAYDEELPNSEPLASVSFKNSYTGKSTTIDFYDYSAMKVLIAVNGESKFFCTKSYLNTLSENVKLIETDQDYIKTW